MDETPSLQLRPWRMDDAPTLARHANNPRIARNMTDGFPHPYSLEDAQAFIQRVSQQDPTQVFALEVNEEPCGGIGIFPQADIFRQNAEMGYWLAEHWWGQGIVPRAIREMVQYGFATFPIERIFARPFGSNTASQRVLEKAGFVHEATFSKTILKHGEQEDEHVYAIRRSDGAHSS